MPGLSRWLQKPPLGTQIDWSNPLTKGLVGCWPFNEGGGNRVYNLASGIMPSGTIYGCSWHGEGLYFDGVDDWVELGLRPYAPTFTVVIGVMPLVVDVNQKTILNIRNTVNTVTSDTVLGYIYSTSTNLVVTIDGDNPVTPALSANKQYFIGATSTDSTAGGSENCCVNSKFYSVANAATIADDATVGFQLGSRTNNNDTRYWYGYMYYFYYWTRKLDRTELYELSIAPYQIFRPALSYWMRPEPAAPAAGQPFMKRWGGVQFAPGNRNVW